MRIAVLALGLALLAPPPARAARIELDDAGSKTASFLRFVADPGERNDVRVDADGTAVVFSDAGAAIGSIAFRCERLDHRARCTHPPDEGIELRLGDGDDRAVLAVAAPDATSCVRATATTGSAARGTRPRWTARATCSTAGPAVTRSRTTAVASAWWWT